MTAPFVGPEAKDDHAGLCCYADVPGDPLCLTDARWHGLVADQYGEPVAGLECCDRHKPILDRLATWVHPHELPCGLPSALFYADVNLCAVPWDEVEQQLTAARAMEVPHV